MSKGIVDVIVGKDDRNGAKRYSFKVKNDDNWYGCGLYNPQIKKGDSIEFEYEASGQWNNVAEGSVKVTRSGPEIVEAKKGWGSFKGKADPAKDVYWKAREERDVSTQARIQLQASRNSALTAVSLLLGAGAVKLPEKQAAKHDAIAALVAEWVERFQNETNSISVGEAVRETDSGKDKGRDEVAGATNTTNNDSWEE